MKHKTPGNPVPVPGHAGPANPVKDGPQNNRRHVSAKQKLCTECPATLDVRFPCYGLSLACSVYRTVEQLGDVK
jgi:hypothetical protein